MKEIDAHTLRTNLKKSLEALDREIGDSPPLGLLATLSAELNVLLRVSPGGGSTMHSFSSLESINLREGPDRAKSMKIRNALLRPIEWLDIGWKTAGVVTAVPIFGAWAAVGLLLVLRDVIKIFSIQLTLTQGHVLHVLAYAQRQGEFSLSIPITIERANTLFGTNYNVQHLRDCLDQLVRLKCIDVDSKNDTARILEEVRL